MRTVEFGTDALAEFGWWITHDRKMALRILSLLQEIGRTPFHGTGKPESLKGNLKSAWSRRITKEHPLVYRVEPERIIVLACRFHYGG